MNQIQTIQIENNTELGPVVSSRTVAEELERQHQHVKRDLEKILMSPNVDTLIIPSQYKDSRGRTQNEYLLTKDGFTLYMFNIQGHNNFKMAYINKFNEMENALQNKLPGSYKEAVAQLLENLERNEELQLENSIQKQQIGELKPKATYYDLVLQNKSLLSVSKIAKDYGMSARALNTLLHDLGIQYKQGDIWLLYAKYHDKGYTQTSTYALDEEHSKVSTKWTQQGRLFIYDLLKDEGILPTIEKQIEI
ncbi:phage antirepressor KilAC domain-containing protein [Staphylococcus saprophyticus]|uniref:phage antirepressor KilAC domain-containing protein n=1 Tax=Staphylococcus saprophyticus TaxID=29385 RepID=UPI00203D4F6B|nr:phage regulatory protein/antirepressor Ant [Staphylococcus saprophyticus]MCM3118951.1 phage regulatory protein/antirepressor Ant [Staphylococcus saprophyticus]MEB8335757.1 phage regulatory protein/antirepressor Ant [Staphylococcus saprophyticus]